MNLLFVLPSVGYGFYLFATSGSPILLLMSLLTVAVWAIVGSQRDQDLKAEVSVRDGRVYLGDKRLSRTPWLWGKPLRNLVYEAVAKSRLESAAVALIAPGTLLDVVTGELFRPELNDRDPHLIIIGRSGSGKTQLLRWLLQSAPEYKVIDFKGGVDFQDLDQAQIFTQQDESEAINWIQGLISTREKEPNASTVWIVVDELGELLRISKLAPVLESVAAKGRGLGVHLVLANQTMTAIPRTIWANCANRVVLQADPVDRVQLGLTHLTPGEWRTGFSGNFEAVAAASSNFR